MMNNPKPWEPDPSLDEARLVAVAELIITISDECTGLHDIKAGDGSWSLGCRIYQRVLNRFDRLSDSGEWPWLRVLTRKYELQLPLMIGSCFIRYFRGEANNPPNMQLFQAEEIQKHFGKPITDPDAFSWFMVLEHDELGRAVRVVVQQANSDGTIQYPWVAARARRKDTNGVVAHIGKPPIDVGKPEITPKTGEQKNSNNVR